MTTRWTITTILDAIRKRAVAGAALNAKAVKSDARALLEAAERLLDGGWQDALERAAERYPQIGAIAEAVEAHRPRTVQPAEGTDGQALRLARLRADLSQTAAAERAGVTQATWSLYESGARGMVPPDKAWAAVAPTEEPAPERPPLGRPPNVPRRRATPEGGTYDVARRGALGLLGMSPVEFARWLYGRQPSVAEARRVYRVLAGDTDPGVQWLAAVLERVPDADARELVAEIAGRLAARGRG